MSKLYLSNSDRKISGVCGGIAEYFNIDSTVVRIIFVVGTLIGFGSLILVYIVAALIMPKQSEW